MDSELGVDEIMHTLARNKQSIWYSLVTGTAETLDANGFRTGQYKVTYAAPVETKMNIRWDSGLARLEGFGINGAGKRRLVTDDLNCPITLGTILWIGITPDAYGEDGAVKHNFAVCEVPQKSLNHIVYIVEEVQVGGDPLPSN